MINKSEVIEIQKIRGASKQYNENNVLRNICNVLSTVLGIKGVMLLIEQLIYGVTTDTYLSISFISFSIIWLYNDLYHEKNHKRECPDGGEIISNERFIPNGVQPYPVIKRALLAPYKKGIKLCGALSVTQILWVIYMTYSYSLYIPNIIRMIVLMIIVSIIVVLSCKSDMATAEMITNLLRENGISEDEACVDFYTEEIDNLSTAYIRIYRYRHKD